VGTTRPQSLDLMNREIGVAIRTVGCLWSLIRGLVNVVVVATDGAAEGDPPREPAFAGGDLLIFSLIAPCAKVTGC